ncbi:hypothetical protein GV828_04135 [Flavobacterium sp. NST-5]|uniref:Peptidase M56 domain-containing protein n=1 Tax=Flavobacterium ichthyis TaxID=2698827 RepID=A0ABW9Z6C7_9FLAO|nr:hypothetical protein [Flavobacterium ichthyis]NBL64390.1 hypothetical protein [Flavobacterium ichthyis]
MLVLVSKFFIPKGYRGITIFPFVILHSIEDKEDLCLLNHEKIHIRQQIEMLVLPFYIWYVIEFFIKFLKYKNWNKAYRNISFEKECYTNEMNLNYLKKRTFWHFFKYL